ncbi:MAG: hypothetical protein KF708_04455 [Pirellulales bacterium]|nr:hypothetical protein [Pirellulales bacterium]
MAARKAGSRGPSKAQAIRDVLNDKGHDTAPKDVIAILAQKKIKVSAAQVSNLKAELARKTGSYQPKRGPRSKANGEITLSTLKAVKAMAEKLGGVEKTRQALDALAQLS